MPRSNLFAESKDHWALDNVINLLPYLVVLVSSVWVLLDARSLGIAKRAGGGFLNMGPVGWFLSCLLLWGFAFPAYLVTRRKHKRAAATHTPGARAQETDLMSQLGALADLHSQGLVTDEEFQAKKKELVRGMLEQ